MYTICEHVNNFLLLYNKELKDIVSLIVQQRRNSKFGFFVRETAHS